MAHSTVPAAGTASDGDDDGPPAVCHLPPVWERELPPPSLPIGVAVLAVLTAIIGILLFVSGLLYVANLYAGTAVPSSLVILHVGNVFGATLLAVLGTVVIILSSALWHQELWAFYLTVGFLFLGLVYLFFTDWITYLFVIVLVVFIYLIAVRHHFY